MTHFPVTQRRLANGLTIVVQPDHRWPLIASMMCYTAGSRYDPPACAGLAHFCEHLAFYGPRDASGRTFPDRIVHAGGSTQASTTTDRICFSALFPRTALETVLAVEAERMTRALDPHDHEGLEVQRRVLIEELRERAQSPLGAAAFEQIHRRLFADGHPYHRPAAGEPDGIRAVTREDVNAFAASHLVPRHAILVLVGDLSIAEAVDVASRLFESLPAGLAHAPNAIVGSSPPHETQMPSLRVPASVLVAHTFVAWAVPGFGQPGWYLAALLIRALAAGRSSPLAQAVVDRAGLARDARGTLITMRDASTLVMTAAAVPGIASGRLEAGLLDAIDRLLSHGLPPASLARARKKALSDHYFIVQSLERRADLCALLSADVDAPERLDTEAARYAAADPDAIAAFASVLRDQPAGARLSFVPRAEAA